MYDTMTSGGDNMRALEEVCLRLMASGMTETEAEHLIMTLLKEESKAFADFMADVEKENTILS